MTLRLENIVIHDKHKQPLFSPLTLDIEAGTVAVIMGPSGCGKSTLLNLVAGHLSDDFHPQGDVILNGKSLLDIPPHRRGVGILFQDDLLFPHLNVWQNLAFALPESVKSNDREVHALRALGHIGLEKIAHSYPEQISGGQRARVSLARMLLTKPSAVLLDEPFSKLDKQLRIQFRDWVFDQLRKASIPTLLVTHDQSDIPKDGNLILPSWNIDHA